MINVRAIANAAIQPVNPDVEVGYRKSNGYTTDAAGKRTPQYLASVPTRAQVQKLDGKKLEHIAGLNLQGVFRTVRIAGNAQGAVRAAAQGGDLFDFPEVPGGPSRTWLVVTVFETWPDWCSVGVALQVNP